MIVNFLNLDLANKYIVLTKTKSHHWNVIDPRFKGLYEFLKEQYNMFHEMVEEFVDGIRPIRGRQIGTIENL
jgi:DNA-binding ferritin-like protein